MSRLLEFLSSFEPRKAKAAAFVGLLAGILVAALFTHYDNVASGKEVAPQSASDQPAEVPSLLPETAVEAAPAAASASTSTSASAPAETGARPAVPEGQALPPQTPTATEFLDAALEQYVRDALSRDSSVRVATLESGETIEFSIDPDLQDAVEKEIKGWAPEEAAFVAVDPHSGEVLAMAGFENGKLSPGRALAANGPAASVFKLVTASALVEAKNVGVGRQVCVRGGHSSIPKSLLFADPKLDTDCQSVAEAMGKSTNVVFARLAYNKLSEAELKTYAERFGFNKAIPFLWPVEVSSLDVPQDRVEFARMAAGFYHANLSPLHGALLAGAIANGGTLMQPQVVRSVTSADGRNLYSLTPRKLGRAVSRTTASKLTTMMLETTASGTAAKYFRKRSKALDGIQVAGKTGSLSRKVGNQMMHYSWFVGFAPADKPVIAFASLVVNGPKWKVKGPVVARKALDAYFGKSLSKAPAAPRRTTRAPKARILPSAAAL